MTSPVLFEEIKTASGKVLAVATLNVEKTLNSLSLAMIDLLRPRLEQWQDDNDVALVLFQGAGDRAFCAGGDIQALYHAMVESTGGPVKYAETFFEQEYRLDYLIHSYKKPVMVWTQGAVMGGGLGIMGGCSHRILTETSRVALPEITIGLFPDAGATIFLNKMPLPIAKFMSLTGCQLNARDARFVGLADYLIPGEQKQVVLDALLASPWQDEPAHNAAVLSELLASFDDIADFAAGQLQAHAQEVSDCLADCVELADFDAALDRLGDRDEWLDRGIQTFRTGCPTTAHIVLEQLSRSASMSMEDKFRMELTIAVHCARNGEFTEGVRALLIDRDRKPVWRYPEMQAVPRDWVLQHFEEIWSEGNPLTDL